MASFNKVIPLLNRVLVQKVAAPKQTAGGILLPQNSEESLDMAKVVAAGPGIRNVDGVLRQCLVQEGQTVLLPSYGGQVVNLKSEKYYIYKDTELVGIVN
jgi:chaperonin GroES